MNNKKGLTLVEVVVAMGLFGVIMVTLFPAFLVTNLINITSKEFTDANYLAQNEIEMVYSLSKTNTVAATKANLVSNHSYVCNPNCYKEVGNFGYSVDFDLVSLANVIPVKVVVNTLSGQYLGDRAQIELYIDFAE